MSQAQDEDTETHRNPVLMTAAEAAALLREFADQVEHGLCCQGTVNWKPAEHAGQGGGRAEVLFSAEYRVGPAGQRGPTGQAEHFARMTVRARPDAVAWPLDLLDPDLSEPQEH